MIKIDFRDDLIIIGSSYMKKRILKENSLKYNVKYIDINELRKKYLFDIKDDALVYIDKKYNLIPEVGSILLNNLYELQSKLYNNEKLDNLVNIKNDLMENNYLIYNKFFKKFLKNKDIIFIDDNYPKYVYKIIAELRKCNNIEVVKEENSENKGLDIYEFKTLEEEIIFLADSITKLIKNGVSLDKIKINKIDNSYKASINRIFNFYGIPYSNDLTKLFYLDDVKLFLDSINQDIEILGINDILESLDINEKVKNKLVSILNKYTNYTYIKDIYEEFIYDLKSTDISFNNYENVIEEIDYESYYPEYDEYIFILGFNQDIIPSTYKDNKYLGDKELELLDSTTSIELNRISKNKLFSFINRCTNLIMSYKLSSNSNTYLKSNYIDELSCLLEVNIKTYDYSYMNEQVNKLLFASNIDEFIKYNTLSDDMNNLYSTYPDLEYKFYSNKYNGIDYETIKKQINNKISLSTTNTSTFFKCKFKFLLDHIYKLSKYEETTSIRIGNLFHEVLCIVYRDNNKDYDKVIDEVVNKMYETKSKKDLFYIEKYRKAIKDMIKVIDDNLSRTDYKNTYFEEWFSIDRTNDLEVKIVGKIDKIMTLKDDYNTYVIVLDYKTGKLHGDFNKVIHGFDMQLLYYLYLIKNTKKIDNPIFTGMYLQAIMNDVLNSEDNKTYEEIVKNTMKLEGFTTDRLSRLYEIDHEYQDNSFIRTISTKADGELSSRAKVLSDDTITELLKIVEENINKVISSIKRSDYEINPKKLGKDNVSCEYCTFKDICYMTNNDIKELKEYKNLEFLRGEDDDTN